MMWELHVFWREISFFLPFSNEDISNDLIITKDYYYLIIGSKLYANKLYAN